MADPFNLSRFLAAQDPVLPQVRIELQSGRKRTHWMWYIFPQLEGLGRSAMSQRFAVRSLEEARSYRAHPILGPRLIECTGLVNAVESRSANQIFGDPDDLKFHASMTLFAMAQPEERAFSEALRKYFRGASHRPTIEKLASA
jgi:uncharacterized protein (DUF1810 family)